MTSICPENKTSAKLYELLSERLAEEGEILPCTMEAMQVYSESPQADIDYAKLMNLDNRSLLDACYSIAFNTYPPDHYVEEWQESIVTLPKEEFHKKFMNSFIRLPAFANQHVRLRNCIYITAPAKLRPGFGKRLRNWMYRTFLPLYKRLPEGCRNGLKKLLWNKFFVR